MNDRSSHLDQLPDGLPEALAWAAWAMRFHLLRAGSLYGLHAAARSPSEWPAASTYWHAWMDWLSAVAEGFEVALEEELPLELRPKAMLLKGESLMTRMDARYVGGLPRGARLEASYEDWCGMLELIEIAGRQIERFDATPMGEGGIEGSGIDLLGALEDSLTLLVYGDDTDQASCADSLEIYRLLRATREERQWSRMDPNPELVLPAAPEEGFRGTPEDLRSAATAFFGHMVDVEKFYMALSPAGARLVAKQREAAVRHLVTGALRMRALAGLDLGMLIPRPGGERPTNLRTLTARTRRYQRSLVLALSADRSRRDLAMSRSTRLRPRTGSY